jgi:alkaline phosphatase D
MSIPGTSVLSSPASVVTTRRSVLGAGLTLGLGPVLDLSLPTSIADPVRLRGPFTLGVASGDPHPDGVVLWTRLAPEPMAEDGRGGMPSYDVEVQWQVAEDERFRRVVRRGRTVARARDAHSVHVEVEGLRPGREYVYRFRTAGHLSPVGHTRTAPAYGAPTASLVAGVMSCAQLEHGWFTAYRRVAEERPDVVLHLGDYLYEYRNGDPDAGEALVRDHEGPETTTLAGYRRRHAQYKSDPDLQAAHAAAPWSVVFDDHEVDDDWAGDTPQFPEEGFLARRAAAFRAYYENMPLRRTSVPRGIDMRLYRRVVWGDLVTVHLMDTRQFRDDQACGDGRQIGCDERLDPARSMIGADQERWLLDGLGRSRTTWDVLGQQVLFAQKDSREGDELELSMDGWDGYAASRRRIVDGIVGQGVRNPVVMTGDVHRHYANDLHASYDDDRSRPFGVELATTSITSGGNGSDLPRGGEVELAENPHIRFASGRRGYVTATFTREAMRADFKVLSSVTEPDAPLSTRASFVVEDGNPGWVEV